MGNNKLDRTQKNLFRLTVASYVILEILCIASIAALINWQGSQAWLIYGLYKPVFLAIILLPFVSQFLYNRVFPKTRDNILNPIIVEGLKVEGCYKSRDANLTMERLLCVVIWTTFICLMLCGAKVFNGDYLIASSTAGERFDIAISLVTWAIIHVAYFKFELD